MMECIQGAGEALQAIPHIFCITADTDPKVLRHFKETARHYRRFILLAEELTKDIAVAVHQTWEEDGPVGRTNRLKILPAAEESIQERAIFF
jgi:hypothetical protein